MIVLRIPTQLGAIDVRRVGVRRSARFWWRWSTGDVSQGPFRHLIDCLRDLTSTYELALECVSRDQVARPRTPRRS